MKRSDRLLPRSGLALFRASSGTFAIFTAIRRLGVGTSWANNALSYTRICRRVLRRCRAGARDVLCTPSHDVPCMADICRVI